MKKAFVYLMIVMLFATALSGCGNDKANGGGGMVTTSPSAAPTAMPTIVPDATPSISPNMDSESTDGTGSAGAGSSTDAPVSGTESTPAAAAGST